MDFVITAFSTFLGATVALLADRVTRRHDAKLIEEASINNLILDLAAKRAFLTGPDWDWADGELERVIGSVTHARTLIRDTRLTLTPRSPFSTDILRMTKACNTFLERSEREADDSLKRALQSLSEELGVAVGRLHAGRPRRILGDGPGSLALH